MGYIRWFHEIGLADSGLVGGKGANLGELTAAGLPVPPGFCITSPAYQKFLKSTGLDQQIQNLLAETNLNDREVASRAAELIRTAIQSQTIPLEIRKEIDQARLALIEDKSLQTEEGLPLAVRSSATAEDQANASFAGQLETYLNVRGSSALLEHVQRCWASLWSERVIAYISNQGLDHRNVSMAVVVQAMIPSEISGVMFSANPVTGSHDEVVINASWGLGEAIVSGLVSPDTITTDKANGRVLKRQTSNKELMIAYDPQGGTEEVAVPEGLRSVPALSDKQVHELTDLARQIEDYYGKPQDIEWGLFRGQWYLLQSRPITTLPSDAQVAYPSDEYNRSMFIEIFPEPLSPVFLSVIEPLFHEMLDFTFKSLGFKPPKDIQAIGVFHNQPYFNRSYIAEAFRPLSPAIREPLIAQMVNPFSDQEEVSSLELSRPYIRMAANILRFMMYFPRRLPGILANYRAEIEKAMAFPCQPASDEEICEWIHRLPFEYANKLLNYDFLMIAVIGRTYRLLGALLKRYYGADTDEVVAKLISGVTGNITMETNKRLWDLSRAARLAPEVEQVLRQVEPAEVRPALQASPAGRGFLRAVDRFLAEFGHREVHMDIFYPTWGEDPIPVFSFIASYLDVDETQSPHQQQERLVRERELLTRMVMKDVEKGLAGHLLVAPLFRWILRQTQTHTRERDTMHFEMTRLFPPIRRLMMELGSRWVADGLIDQQEDIFYLGVDEMAELANERQPVSEKIELRKGAFSDSRRNPGPNIIRDGKAVYADQAGVVAEDSGLHGVAGSPGRAAGKTCVIMGPDEFGKLKKGDILVAPITNPVWTPLFAIAGGVVTEVGGILSHGAIVAREYGIPAVMSVPGVTRRLLDGQRVTVDGSKGVVYLEMEA
jgi:phosphohistidine swiveling domain-containing protein